jgi:hypothetical protein
VVAASGTIERFHFWCIEGNQTGGGFAALGAHGTEDVPTAGKLRVSRSAAASCTNNSGTLSMFGGFSYEVSGQGLLNDLWMFNPATAEWTWEERYLNDQMRAVSYPDGILASHNCEMRLPRAEVLLGG